MMEDDREEVRSGDSSALTDIKYDSFFYPKNLNPRQPGINK